ncbi:MAG TPA: hypothetical protein VJ873_00655, partial [bacterium]|nr:hypothetical protein [bacterium]
MRQTFLPLALFIFSLCSQLWAAPATLENNDYKVTFSETLPGIDAGGALLMPGAGVTLTVTDKFRSQQILYPLQGYAVPNDFLLGDTLNLILRTTLINTPSGPRYNFIQLDLANPSDSHQFSGLSQYSFSPDQQNIFLVVDKGEGAPWLGLSQLTGNPLSMQWLYAEGAGINLF